MGLTLVAYLITDNVMDVANKMRKELEYSTKVRECSLACEIANHPRVVSTLHNDISYKLYIVKSENQVPMNERCFRTFSEAFTWATGNDSQALSYRYHTLVESTCSLAGRQETDTSPWIAAAPELKHHIIPEIKRIEQNIKKGAIYTTVIWVDDSKPTVVKCAKGDTSDIYFAVASAIAIKVYGSNSAFKREIRNLTGMSF